MPPERRASDKPIAMACLRLRTFLPERPERSVPCFISCMVLSTFSLAFFPYLREPRRADVLRDELLRAEVLRAVLREVLRAEVLREVLRAALRVEVERLRDFLRDAMRHD